MLSLLQTDFYQNIIYRTCTKSFILCQTLPVGVGPAGVNPDLLFCHEISTCSSSTIFQLSIKRLRSFSPLLTVSSSGRCSLIIPRAAMWVRVTYQSCSVQLSSLGRHLIRTAAVIIHLCECNMSGAFPAACR